MAFFAILKPSAATSKFSHLSLRFVAFVFLFSVFVTFSSTATAGSTLTVIEVGSATLAHDKSENNPRWVRVNITPLISGTHTVRVVWGSDADIRFSVFETSSQIRIATSVGSAIPNEWTGELDGSEQYYLGVWAASGSANFTATVEAETIDPDPIEITAQPTDLTVSQGEDAVFEVTATGSGNIIYQWFLNGTAIVGSTSATLLISPALSTDDGNIYRVDITDDNGTLSSHSATLTMAEPVLPVTVANLGQGTLDSEKAIGARFIRLYFDSLAAAIHTIKVSWGSDADIRFNVFNVGGTRINNSPISGSNPAIWAGELDANEQYYIGLWSADGIANYTATVEATTPVTLDSQPSDLMVTEGDDARFSVEASGSGILSYQWFADGLPIVGETADSLIVLATFLAESGTQYTVEVSNGFETRSSDFATLTVNEPVVLGLFSQEADTSTWMLDGPAPTLDYEAGEDTDAWGKALLRIGDILLAGGDFQGIKPTRNGPVTEQPFLAALDAVSGQPVSTFQVPYQVDSVVRALALSPNGNQVYVGGDFGLLVLDAVSGELDFAISVTDGANEGRVFDIALTNTQVYIGGDFSNVDNTYRANLARLSLGGELDPTWSPSVTNGFAAGRAAPVQSVTVSPSGDTVYVGGNFRFIDDTPVSTTPQNKRISMLTLSALDGTVQPERFIPNVGDNPKGVTAHDIVVTEFYVIIAWGGPNFLSFHSLTGDLLRQYKGKGDVQALQVVGDHVFVGHHGEFFGFLPNPVPQEALESLDPEIILPFKLHSFRIDDPSFLPEQAWTIKGVFGVWGIAASEDSVWLTGQLSRAGSNDRSVDGLVRFPALD